MQDTGDTQHELRDLYLELLAIFGLHLVTAPHRADLGGQYRAAGVLKTLAGLEQRLLANHTLSAYFLDMVIGIGDDPVATDQFGG